MPRLAYIDSSCTSLPWHCDAFKENGSRTSRIFAARTELSVSPYEGGVFEFKNENKEVQKLSELLYGETAIFEVATSLEHRVTSVTKGERRSLHMFFCE